MSEYLAPGHSRRTLGAAEQSMLGELFGPGNSMLNRLPVGLLSLKAEALTPLPEPASGLLLLLGSAILLRRRSA